MSFILLLPVGSAKHGAARDAVATRTLPPPLAVNLNRSHPVACRNTAATAAAAAAAVAAAIGCLIQGYGLDMEKEIGVGLQSNGEYRGRCVAHMDAIYWVKR